MNPPSGIYAIPTMYRGVLFRSRLEARWAAFFDLLDWPWLYEPIDLDFYIPDFVVTLPRGELLVEVKPETTAEELHAHTGKIYRSGWKGDSMIVGGTLLDRKAMGGMSLGIANEREGDELGAFDHAVLAKCTGCDRFSFFHEGGAWTCRVSGCEDVEPYVSTLPREDARRLWAEAGNRTQWRGPGRDEGAAE